MIAILSWTFDVSSPLLWVAAAIGLSCMFLALRFGHRILFQSARSGVGPTEGSDDSSDHDPYVDGSTTERRAAFRRKGNPVEVSISDEHYRIAPASGYILDRSVGGLCVQARLELQVGTIITMRPVKAPESVPWVQLVVKSCRPMPGGFEVGCQFVKTPPWGVLVHFG